MFAVYILYSAMLDSYYIGMTSDLEGRLRRHNSKSRGYSSRANDWVLRYKEEFANKASAYDRERQIKSWKSRVMVQALISSAGPEHSD
jgi:putative endonuclease